VALSFASPRPGVTRHAARMEFGLSSPIARSDHVARSEPSLAYHAGPIGTSVPVALILEVAHPVLDVDRACGRAVIRLGTSRAETLEELSG
jgi:hypothetical protein